MSVRESFETFWKETYAFEMKRGEGRNSHGLKLVDGKYIADKTQFGYEIWCAAKGVKSE